MSQKVDGLIHALTDGLCGFLAFESRCGMSAAYNEYFLYRPIIEIVKHRQGWRLISEWPLNQQTERSGSGDHKRIDFLFESKGSTDSSEESIFIAAEIKWANNATSYLDVKRDVTKLISLFSTPPGGKIPKASHTKLRAFLIVIGAHGFDVNGAPSLKVKLRGLPDTASKVLTKGYKASGTRVNYGVTIFELTYPSDDEQICN
jgi:hypothetical protein